MKLLSLLSILSLICFSTTAMAQCPFDPTVEGETILCPGGASELSTQAYDSYLWYQRPYGDSIAMPVSGATGQTFTVTEADILSYVSVEATLNGCTETSPEVLIDGYVFLLPFVIQNGEYTFDPNTQTFVVCEGDTMTLTLGNPYDTNITWFRNDQPIAGETGQTLEITQTGAYTVEGAPSVCPNYIQPLGLTLNVLVEACSTGTKPEPVPAFLNIYPNPAGDWLRIRNEGTMPVEKIELSDATGRTVKTLDPANGFDMQLTLDEMPGGIYLLKIVVNGRRYIHKISKE